MITIENNNITISKGDDAIVNFFLSKNEDNIKVNYILSENDTAILTIKKNSNEIGKILELIKHGDGTNKVSFVFSSTDLNKLEIGIYKYDVRIKVIKDNVEKIITPFPPAKFTITEVIGDV